MIARSPRQPAQFSKEGLPFLGEAVSQGTVHLRAGAGDSHTFPDEACCLGQLAEHRGPQRGRLLTTDERTGVKFL